MPSAIDATIVDGAAVVNMIKPGTEKTFSGYAEQSFLPYVKTQLRHVKRVDIVWDEYVENSLKATTRSDRGAAVRGRVAANNQLPRNWKEFLRVDENKRELFKFLAESTSSLEVEKQILSTYGKQILTTLPRNYHVMTSQVWLPVHTKRPTRKCCCMFKMLYNKVIRRSFCAQLTGMPLFW